MPFSVCILFILSFCLILALSVFHSLFLCHSFVFLILWRSVSGSAFAVFNFCFSFCGLCCLPGDHEYLMRDELQLQPQNSTNSAAAEASDFTAAQLAKMLSNYSTLHSLLFSFFVHSLQPIVNWHISVFTFHNFRTFLWAHWRSCPLACLMSCHWLGSTWVLR